MRVAIVDDEKYWRECIQSEITQYDIKEEIEIFMFSSGEQFLQSNEKFDISLVDISMQGIDGFDTILAARKNNSEGIYMILTTHTEMSRKGYIVNAFRYIDKAELQELQEAFTSAQIVLGRNKRIMFNIIDFGIREFVLKDIIFIETEKHYTLLHTKNGKVKCNDNMKDIEKKLPSKWFFRCHNAYIVNLDEIDCIKGRIVYLSSGNNIDVSLRKLNEFKKIYIDRQFICASK